MASRLDVQPETAEKISALAQARGVSVDAYLLSLLEETQPGHTVSESHQQRRASLEEFRATLDALAAHPSKNSAPYQGTYSREDIYVDHD